MYPKFSISWAAVELQDCESSRLDATLRDSKDNIINSMFLIKQAAIALPALKSWLPKT